MNIFFCQCQNLCSFFRNTPATNLHGIKNTKKYNIQSTKKAINFLITQFFIPVILSLLKITGVFKDSYDSIMIDHPVQRSGFISNISIQFIVDFIFSTTAYIYSSWNEWLKSWNECIMVKLIMKCKALYEYRKK